MLLEDESKLEWRTVKEVFRQYRANLRTIQSSFDAEGQVTLCYTDASVDLVMDYELARMEAARYNELVMSCVERLSKDEQKIILLSYTSSSRIPPWKIYEKEIHVSRTLFYTAKSKAVGKLYVLFDINGLVKRQ